jgi:hypothetical protein
MNKFKQVIKNVQDSTALVESKKGNIYPVVIADRIRLSDKKPKVGDIGIVYRVNGKYYLYDFIPKPDETDSCLSKVPLEDLGYDY